MKKVFFINVKDDKLVEGELDTMHSKPLQQINTTEGPVYVPSSMKLWDNKTELMADTFVRYFRMGIGFDNLMLKFNLDKSEAQVYLDSALKKFPEKFI